MQLIHGIRYFDMRITYQKDEKYKFWTYHGIIKMHPLKMILDQVREFILATNEIIILDFQEFDTTFGKNFTIHEELVNSIYNQIGDIISPTMEWDVKLGVIWRNYLNVDNMRRVILAYDNQYMVMHRATILRISVEQLWGNCQTLKYLNIYTFLAVHYYYNLK